MKHYAIALLLMLSAQGAAAQQTRLLTADKHNEYGLVYSLPQTAFNVRVTALHTTLKAGPYAKYAKKYVGTSDVITADADSWVIKEVEVIPYGIADPDQSYLMQLKPGSTTYIVVAEDGMLLSVNCQPAETRGDATRQQHTPSPQKHFTGKEYLQFVNSDFLASQSSAKQAQMLAESLMEIRDSRISLTRGTADTMPTDGRQLELMLNSLEEQENALTAAFTGSSSSETVTRTFTLIPSEEGRSIVFRMSDFAGFCDSDDYRGAPVYADIAVTRRGELPLDQKGEEKKMPKDAVVYALPGTAQITLTLDGKTLYDREQEVAQFGTVFGLNPSLFTDRKDPSSATFNPATGALMELRSVSE